MDLQNGILDYLGHNYTESELHYDFDGKSQAECLELLNKWFPQCDNEELSIRIYKFVK